MKAIVCECETPNLKLVDVDGEHVVECYDCGREVVEQSVARILRLVQVAVAKGLPDLVDQVVEKLQGAPATTAPAQAALPREPPEPEPWIGSTEAGRVAGRTAQYMRDNWRGSAANVPATETSRATGSSAAGSRR